VNRKSRRTEIFQSYEVSGVSRLAQQSTIGQAEDELVTGCFGGAITKILTRPGHAGKPLILALKRDKISVIEHRLENLVRCL